MTKRRRQQLGVDREYRDLCRAADALIRRYLRGRMVGMPAVGYPRECPYIDHPPRAAGGDLALDAQIRTCIDLVNSWPSGIASVIRLHWGDSKSIREIARVYDVDRRRVSAIISTARYQVIRDCIEPFTIGG